LDKPSEKEANIGGIWGEFTLSRSKIKGGIRFSLIECPNALYWTNVRDNLKTCAFHDNVERLEKGKAIYTEK